jgi:hypothetical protein
MIKITLENKTERHETEKKTYNQEKSKSIKALKNNETGSPEFKISGLCTSCAERERCPFPKVDGGVWHCEGYIETGKSKD